MTFAEFGPFIFGVSLGFVIGVSAAIYWIGKME